MAARFPGHLTDRVLAVTKLVAKPRISIGFLDRGQVLPLNILDQRDGEGFGLVEIADDRRNLMQTGALRGAPAAFSSDELEPVAVGGRADEDRLDDTARGNRFGQFLQRILIEATARLHRVRMHVGYGQHRKAIALAGGGIERDIGLDIAK